MDGLVAPASPDLLTVGIGLLAVRLVIGLYMFAHGAQKLFGWFGGYGVTGTSVFFEQLGFRPARLFVLVASGTEVVSGLLVAFGLLGPIGPALMLSVLIVAAITVHWQHGLFAAQNGIEHAVIFAAAAFALGLTGPGPISLDAALGLQSLWTAPLVWIVLAMGAIGGTANLFLRRSSPTPAAR